MNEEYVFVVHTPTRIYIEIVEPGGQVSLRKITLSLEQASIIRSQLGRVLESLGEGRED